MAGKWGKKIRSFRAVRLRRIRKPHTENVVPFHVCAPEEEEKWGADEQIKRDNDRINIDFCNYYLLE